MRIFCGKPRWNACARGLLAFSLAILTLLATLGAIQPYATAQSTIGSSDANTMPTPQPSPSRAVTQAADTIGTQDASAAVTQKTGTATADFGVDHKPRLYRMLNYNSRIDANMDELRMDFVLRVAHGDVNPQNSSPGLSIVYSYDGTTTNTRTASYFGAQSDADKIRNWTNNEGDIFVIQSSQTVGDYDYLAISIRGDFDYPNSPDPNVVGGTQVPLYVYAVLGNVGALSVPQMESMPSIATNMAVDPATGKALPLHTYATDRCTSPAPVNGKITCTGNGPILGIGYDSTPQMFNSEAGTGWGLNVAHGFSQAGTGPGIAPAHSFFTYFNDYDLVSRDNGTSDGEGLANPHPYSVVSSFYFQWLALSAAGQWVPADALTPIAQIGTQKPGNTANFNKWNNYSALNAPASGNNTAMLASGDAQRPDGSIDFARAMAEQKTGGRPSGYFKLVVWPITRSSAGSDDRYVTAQDQDVFNPLTSVASGASNGGKGITAGMGAAEAQRIADLGWSNASVFDGFALAKPTPPTIDAPKVGPSGLLYASTQNVGGTGTPGMDVDLFVSTPDPASGEVAATTTKRVESYVGTATVGADGRWKLPDSVDESNPYARIRSYRAWQYPPPGSGVKSATSAPGTPITATTVTTTAPATSAPGNSVDPLDLSGYSNVYTVTFVPAPAKTPVISAVSIPHTLASAGGKLAAGAAVKVSGTDVWPIGEAATTLSLCVQPADADYHPLSGSAAVCTDVTVEPGQTAWSVAIPALRLLPPAMPKGTNHAVFSATLRNARGASSKAAQLNEVLDMVAPVLQIDSADTSAITGNTKDDTGRPEAGDTVTIRWPGGKRSITTTDRDGHWQITVPESSASPNAKGHYTVSVTDDQHNEGADQTLGLPLLPPVSPLPKAGSASVWVWLAALGASAVTAVARYAYKHAYSRAKP
ncbi:hypothetical protein [Bifidobacterium sp. ESL0800]|uniref:hypothetical protein n=1 Tax=Bifidobacterium sp. ESL0800 TaxID=2983236 RepID=UPI0023FA0441|nr:hypothetical protein [Bifidobacterium sp. ESL0800]WEV75452.1 hypothetical protein OZX75_07480 [Bifidobacterium sp. ESL0800]